MKLEQIPGDYDNVDQRALELLKTNDYELALPNQDPYNTPVWIRDA